MILKILSRKNPGAYKSLIKYILQPSKGVEGQSPEPILHNIRRSDDINGFARQFYQNEALRKIPRKNQVFMYHAILSFGERDSEHITPEILKDISQKFIELRGDKSMMLGSVHHDRNHAHLHYIISSCEYMTGKGFRMSKSELHELKQNLQNYHLEKYPHIAHSAPQHGTGREYNNKEYGYTSRTNKKLIKQEIAEKVKFCLLQSKSQTHFLDLLRKNGLHHYERVNGIATGVMVDDTKYRFSRLLGDDLEVFKKLPLDRTEAEIALKEIQSIREQSATNRELDIPDL